MNGREKKDHVGREVSNLPVLRVGQAVQGIFLIVLGAVTFKIAAPSRGSVFFPLLAVAMGLLCFLYTTILWKPEKRTVVMGVYLNASAAMLAALIMTYNAATLTRGKQEAIGTFMLSFLVMVMSGGLGST